MNLKTLIATALFTGALSTNAADYAMTPLSLTAESGSTAELSINMKNGDLEVVSFQFDLYLPSGVKVEEDAYSTPIATLAADRIVDHIVNAAAQTDGAVRYLSYSNNNRVYQGSEGVIITTPIKIDVEPGTYEIAIRNSSLTHAEDFIEFFPPEATAILTVTTPEVKRYGENQLYVRDISVSKGESAQMLIGYNSSADVYEYSAEITLPTSVSATAVSFEPVVAEIENFTNEWSFEAPVIKINGTYGGGRRDELAQGGDIIFAIATLDTSALEPGDYDITLGAQLLSNDTDDYSPEAYVAKLTVLGATEPEPLEQCAVPEISFEDGNLKGVCATPDALIHTTIVAEDHQTFLHGDSEAVPLTGIYHITSYATADGMADSDPISMTLAWVKDYDSQSEVEILQSGTDRPIIIISTGSNFRILGTQCYEPIELYDLGGNLMYSGFAEDTSYTIPVAVAPSTIYIIRIGKTSIKTML